MPFTTVYVLAGRTDDMQTRGNFPNYELRGTISGIVLGVVNELAGESMPRGESATTLKGWSGCPCDLVLVVALKWSARRADLLTEIEQTIWERVVLLYGALVSVDVHVNLIRERTAMDPKVLAMPVRVFFAGFQTYSDKVANCLEGMGWDTVVQVTHKTRGELLAITNFGARSLELVEERLAAAGLRLRPNH